MEVTKKQLEEAVRREIISSEQGKGLWAFLQEQTELKPQFQLSHLAYYFGALLVMFALGWFMHNAWQWFGGSGMFVLALAYATGFLLLGNFFWRQKGLFLPGGLLVVLAVAMTPLAVYGLERWLGYWPQFEPGHYTDFASLSHKSYFWMEVATLLSALVALRFYAFTFLMAPFSAALYFMSLDVAPFLLGTDFLWQDARWISLYFGAAMLLASIYIDARCRRLDKEDYAFWTYLFGTTAFWGSLTLMDSSSEWSRFAYCMVNIFLLFCGVLLQRKAFLVFGTLGVSSYIGRLTYQLFKDSLLFPFALTFLGLIIIYGGILYSKKQKVIEGWLRKHLPQGILRFLPGGQDHTTA